jgi:hypothetical protein
MCYYRFNLCILCFQHLYLFTLVMHYHCNTADMNYRSTFNENIPTDALITRLEAQHKEDLAKQSAIFGGGNAAAASASEKNQMTPYGSDREGKPRRSSTMMPDFHHMTNYIDLTALAPDVSKTKSEDFNDAQLESIILSLDDVYESDDEDEIDAEIDVREIVFWSG